MKGIVHVPLKIIAALIIIVVVIVIGIIIFGYGRDLFQPIVESVKGYKIT